MYKYYKKNNYNVMYYCFDSISEFLDYIDNHPTSKAFDDDNLWSIKAEFDGWYGTKSLEEAENFAKYGYDKGFDKFVELKDKLEKYIKLTATKPRQHNDYVGYVPDTKAYLEGNPTSMLNRINPIVKQIDIYFNISYSCETYTSQIFNRGVITLSIVEALEKMGFSVNLNIFSMATNYPDIHYSVFRLKNPHERLNIKKLFFPLCNNSWLRRLIFRLKEETPDITWAWKDGYGSPADEYTIREIIDLKKNDIVIPQPSEIGIRGNDLISDANTMFNYINEKRNTKDFELPHLKRQKSKK